MNVEELIERAWAAVKKAGVPANLQDSAFRAAIEFLRDDDGNGDPPGGESKIGRSGGTHRRRENPPGDDKKPEKVDEAAFFKGVAQHTGVPTSALKDVYHFEDGELRVNLPGSKLGASKKARVENLVYLLAGGYLFGLQRPGVPSDTVRAAAKKISALDANYATYVRALNKHVSFSGPKLQKTVELKPQGETEFSRRLKLVTGIDVGDE